MKQNISRSLRVTATALALSSALLVAGRAHAETTATEEQKRACLDSHEAAQVSRNAGHLLEALEATRTCSQASCPGAIREDCVQWFQETKRAVPSVVVTAEALDSDLFDVRVVIDGKLATTHLDGQPLELDPGSHLFRFESAGFAPVEKQILVVPGEKLRTLAVSFAPSTQSQPHDVAPAKRESAPTETSHARGLPVMTYVAASGALLGAVGFAGFGLWGLDQRSSLQSSCEPVCSSSEVSSVRTKFIVADVSLGVAIASTVAAGILYFSRPSEKAPGVVHSRSQARRPSLQPSVDIGPRGLASLNLRGEF